MDSPIYFYFVPLFKMAVIFKTNSFPLGLLTHAGHLLYINPDIDPEFINLIYF